jgi:hypothetical protein
MHKCKCGTWIHKDEIVCKKCEHELSDFWNKLFEEKRIDKHIKK